MWCELNLVFLLRFLCLVWKSSVFRFGLILFCCLCSGLCLVMIFVLRCSLRWCVRLMCCRWF